MNVQNAVIGLPKDYTLSGIVTFLQQPPIIIFLTLAGVILVIIVMLCFLALSKLSSDTHENEVTINRLATKNVELSDSLLEVTTNWESEKINRLQSDSLHAKHVESLECERESLLSQVSKSCSDLSAAQKDLEIVDNNLRAFHSIHRSISDWLRPLLKSRVSYVKMLILADLTLPDSNVTSTLLLENGNDPSYYRAVSLDPKDDSGSILVPRSVDIVNPEYLFLLYTPSLNVQFIFTESKYPLLGNLDNAMDTLGFSHFIKSKSVHTVPIFLGGVMSNLDTNGDIIYSDILNSITQGNNNLAVDSILNHFLLDTTSE